MAARDDAAGRHDEAIDCLARATQLGDVEAKTRLAKRLIVGDRAPLLGRQGAAFMREAAMAGGAEAAALLAVLAAVGAGFNLMETDLVHLMVQTRIAVASGLPLVNMEGATVLHYAEGQEIDNHYDFIDPSIPNYADEVRTRGERVVTFLVYLNEEYEAGETDFPRLGVTHKGRRGEGLSFSNALPSGQPDLRSWHAGRPPRGGEKWILSQFIRNRPVLEL